MAIAATNRFRGQRVFPTSPYNFKMKWLGLFRFRLASMLILLSAFCIWLGLCVVPPVQNSEVVGWWSCECGFLTSASSQEAGCDRSVHFELSDDGGYFGCIRGIQFGTTEESESKWHLQPAQTIWGRYTLVLENRSLPVRFSRSHDTLYVTIGGEEVALQKRDYSEAIAKESAALQELRGTRAIIETLNNRHVVAIWVEGREEFSDSDLERISDLPHLRTLWLNSTGVTDEGLVQIGKCRQLEELAILTLYQTNEPSKITDAGLSELASLTNLKCLCLTESDITDDGLVFLREIKGLRELDLAGTNISGEGLKHLRHLSKLRYLNVQNTQWESKRGAVTREDAEMLRSHLPKCDIAY